MQPERDAKDPKDAKQAKDTKEVKEHKEDAVARGVDTSIAAAAAVSPFNRVLAPLDTLKVNRMLCNYGICTKKAAEI